MNHKTYPSSRRQTMAIAAVAALVTGLLLLSSAGQVLAQPATRWVNDDDPNGGGYAPPGTSCDDPGYSTISAAVAAASPGDTINVCPGTYTENVVISTNNVKIISTGGASVTTVSVPEATSVFKITAFNVTLDGFTIVPAGTGDGDIGVFVAVEGNADATIVHNVINGGRIGINLGCASASSTIAHNSITVADFDDIVAINIDTCEGSEFGSDDNSVHHNTACGGVSSRSIQTGGKSSDNVIHHNIVTGLIINDPGNVVHHNTAKVLLLIAPGNIEHHNTIDPSVCP